MTGSDDPHPDPSVVASLLREWAATMGLVVALFVGYFVMPMDGRWWPVAAAAGIGVIIGLVPLSIRHVRRILGSSHPVSDAARALIVLLAIVVTGFATSYYSMEIHSPGQVAGLQTKTDSLYLTVTIVTTVGFGDVHPQGRAARLLATAQMLFDVLVLAVAVRGIGWAGKQGASSDRFRGRLPGREPPAAG